MSALPFPLQALQPKIVPSLLGDGGCLNTFCNFYIIFLHEAVGGLFIKMDGTVPRQEPIKSTTASFSHLSITWEAAGAYAMHP